jgi:hypothetical protein
VVLLSCGQVDGSLTIFFQAPARHDDALFVEQRILESRNVTVCAPLRAPFQAAPPLFTFAGTMLPLCFGNPHSRAASVMRNRTVAHIFNSAVRLGTNAASAIAGAPRCGSYGAGSKPSPLPSRFLILLRIEAGIGSSQSRHAPQFPLVFFDRRQEQLRITGRSAKTS